MSPPEDPIPRVNAYVNARDLLGLQSMIADDKDNSIKNHLITLALRTDDHDVLRMLMSAGYPFDDARLRMLSDGLFFTPLQYAVERSSLNTIELLQTFGAHAPIDLGTLRMHPLALALNRDVAVFQRIYTLSSFKSDEERELALVYLLNWAVPNNRFHHVEQLLEWGAPVGSFARGSWLEPWRNTAMADECRELLRRYGAQFVHNVPRAQATSVQKRISKGILVTHPKFGRGVVTDIAEGIDADKLTIAFDSGAVKLLHAKFVTILEQATTAPKPENKDLELILQNPSDIGARQVYADKLVEQNDPRGEFIIAQCQQLQAKVDSPEYHALCERSKELLQSHRQSWVSELGVKARNVEFERGFVTHVELTAQQVVDHAASLFSKTPLERLTIQFPDETWIERIATMELLQQLTTLNLRKSTLHSGAIEKLLRSKTFRALEHITLDECWYAYQPSADADLGKALCQWPWRPLKTVKVTASLPQFMREMKSNFTTNDQVLWTRK